MRIIVVFVLAFTSFIGYSQQVDSLDLFYILDSYKVPNKQNIPILDSSPNYFQMSKGEAVIIGRIRGNSFAHQGEVQNYIQIDSTSSFYILGNQFSVGKMASFEIEKLQNDKVQIHYFTKLNNKLDVFFIAHKATLEEINEIKEYWQSH